jgi:hypothetical protein
MVRRTLVIAVATIVSTWSAWLGVTPTAGRA